VTLVPLINRLLVANRGEIARRIFHTCRQAGIGTVAVYSDPDASSPHVAEADLAVRLPGAASAGTYLNGPAIVAAALAAGADAVHPGYGFLSEDHRFARQVQNAGLVWVGPPREAMQAMGLKIEARKMAIAAGVPVLAELDPGSVTTFPVLVKASAGGGGRGMRAVHSAADLAEAVASARREAQAAFGDDTVYCEPLLAYARHIEVQVMADQYGTVWTLTERDCSVQRRYAKVIEETPSPVVSPQLRERLMAAAEALARSVGYVSAGTVEFLLGNTGEFYFLEFNTRLQVEHPVTECVHDLDLVALQIGIAEGQPLPPVPPEAAGHAIEARLYAEDPADGFRPSAGPVHAFVVRAVDTTFGLASHTGATLRVDAGVVPGTVVPPYYDAMLAKVIAWGPTRPEAARRLTAALADATIAGPATNRDLLVSVLRGAEFTDGQANTALLASYDYASLVPDDRVIGLSAAAAAAAIATANRQQAKVAASVPGGWRNVPSQPQRTSFAGPRGQVDISYQWTRAGITILQATAQSEIGLPQIGLPQIGLPQIGLPQIGLSENGLSESGVSAVAPLGGGPGAGPGAGLATVVAAGDDEVLLEAAGVGYRFRVTRAGARLWVDSALGSVTLGLLDRLPVPEQAVEAGSLVAPMPGNVAKVAVSPGEAVAAGQVVLVLEAMKMEHQILAPVSGVLAELRVRPGTQVNAGEVLAIVTSDPVVGEHVVSDPVVGDPVVGDAGGQE
jgi:propionyl-CoA carboxylase alpha chain